MNLDAEDLDDSIADPSETDVRAAIGRLNSRGPRFAGLRIRPHYFIQAYALDDGRLDVDYRDGGPAQAYIAPFPQSKEAVADAFLSYLYGDNRWRTAFEWKKVPEESQ